MEYKVKLNTCFESDSGTEAANKPDGSSVVVENFSEKLTSSLSDGIVIFSYLMALFFIIFLGLALSTIA